MITPPPPRVSSICCNYSIERLEGLAQGAVNRARFAWCDQQTLRVIDPLHFVPISNRRRTDRASQACPRGSGSPGVASCAWVSSCPADECCLRLTTCRGRKCGFSSAEKEKRRGAGAGNEPAAAPPLPRRPRRGSARTVPGPCSVFRPGISLTKTSSRRRRPHALAAGICGCGFGPSSEGARGHRAGGALCEPAGPAGVRPPGQRRV